MKTKYWSNHIYAIFFRILCLGCLVGGTACQEITSVASFGAKKRNRTTRDSTEKYAFIQYDKNEIFTPEANTLEKFYKELDSLKQYKRSKVNIVHFGDSHIQADFFTGQVRYNFHKDDTFGNGGRGYIFPCGLASKTNDPFSINLKYEGDWKGCRNVQKSKSCRWGLAGMIATTEDVEASFTIKPYNVNNITYPITKVRLYYPTDEPELFSIRLWDGVGFVSPHRIYREGFAEFFLSQSVDKVGVCMKKNSLNQHYFSFEGISLDNNESGVVYHSVGVNGAEVSSFLRNPNLENHLQSLEPALVIISLGTNDCYKVKFDDEEFKQLFSELLQRIRKACPDVNILLTTPGDHFIKNYQFNKYTNLVVKRIFELAKEHNVAVWNLYEIMGGYTSIDNWMKTGLAASDRVHFTRKGYYLQGDLLFDALMKQYPK